MRVRSIAFYYLESLIRALTIARNRCVISAVITRKNVSIHLGGHRGQELFNFWWIDLLLILKCFNSKLHVIASDLGYE